MIGSLLDFRSLSELIKAVLAEEKLHFSTPQKRLADELQISAPLLSMVCEGKRNLSFASLLRLSRKLKCQDNEFAYLEVLWALSNETDDEAREFLENRRLQFKESDHSSKLRVAALSQFSRWHILPLFVYITDMAQRLVGRLESAIADARTALELKGSESALNMGFSLWMSCLGAFAPFPFVERGQ